MSILSRYLGREALGGAMAATLVLTVLGLTGRLVDYLAEAAQGRLSPDLVMVAIVGRIPGILQIVLPLSFFLGVLMLVGRLYADQEAAALRAAGVGPARVTRLLLWPTALVLTVVAGLALGVTPTTASWVQTQLTEAERVAGLDALAPGRFQSIGQGAVLYAESADADGALLRVFIHESGQPGAVYKAEKALQQRDPDTEQRFLVLSNGERWAGHPGGLEWSALAFDEYRVRLDLPPSRARPTRLEALPTETLLAGGPRERSMIHWRVALALMVPVGLLLALSLAPVPPRKGRWSRVLPGVLLFLTYFALINLAQSKTADGEWPELHALWPIHLLMLAVCAILYRANRAVGSV